MATVRDAAPDPSWLAECKAKQAGVLIPEPWKDALCKKSGLVNYYYISAFVETLRIKAASKEYGAISGLLQDYLAERERYERFQALHSWIESYLQRPCKVVRWKGPDIPDIRCLMTPEECLSYCASRHGASWPAAEDS